jgi:hypothetical protein
MPDGSVAAELRAERDRTLARRREAAHVRLRAGLVKLAVRTATRPDGP